MICSCKQLLQHDRTCSAITNTFITVCAIIFWQLEELYTFQLMARAGLSKRHIPFTYFPLPYLPSRHQFTLSLSRVHAMIPITRPIVPLPIPHPSLPQNASVEDRHSQTTFIPSRLNNYTNMYAGTIICRVLLKHNHFKSLRCLKLPCQAGRSCSLRRSKTAARSDGLKHPLPITMMTDRA